MSAKEFIDLVCQMRSAQKRFLRTHLQEEQEQSKELERKVDQALRNFSDEETLPLFIQHFDPS
jgi:hypothetical protein